eukprot:717139_1
MSNNYLPQHRSSFNVNNVRFHPYQNQSNNTNEIAQHLNVRTEQSCRNRLEQTLNAQKNKAIKLMKLKLQFNSGIDDPLSVIVNVPTQFTLYQLHDFIQNIFDYRDTHLHQFLLTVHDQTVTFEVPDDEDSQFRTDIPNTNGSQWLSHDHPHCLASFRYQRQRELDCKWKVDERSITLEDILHDEEQYNVLEYHYDFGGNIELFVIPLSVQNILDPDDLQYPKIVSADTGRYPVEDTNRFIEFDRFAANTRVNDNYANQWPLEMRQNDRIATHCYVCRKDVCPNRTQCSGANCCDFCLKKVDIQNNVNLNQIYSVYIGMLAELDAQKQGRILNEPCNYIEPDGTPCCLCVNW